LIYNNESDSILSYYNRDQYNNIIFSWDGYYIDGKLYNVDESAKFDNVAIAKNVISDIELQINDDLKSTYSLLEVKYTNYIKCELLTIND
jgi:hypothetical protein